MISFLSKSEKRKLNILELLYSEDTIWSTQKIASTLGCSIDSVLHSLTLLTTIIEENQLSCFIQMKNNKEVYLSTESYSAVNKLRILVIQNSVSFQILDAIFQSGNLTIDKLQKELFLSKSTIYRKLETLEKLFLKMILFFQKLI